jgi:hypothetical protein
MRINAYWRFEEDWALLNENSNKYRSANQS